MRSAATSWLIIPARPLQRRVVRVSVLGSASRARWRRERGRPVRIARRRARSCSSLIRPESSPTTTVPIAQLCRHGARWPVDRSQACAAGLIDGVSGLRKVAHVAVPAGLVCRGKQARARRGSVRSRVAVVRAPLLAGPLPRRRRRSYPVPSLRRGGLRGNRTNHRVLVPALASARQLAGAGLAMNGRETLWAAPRELALTLAQVVLMSPPSMT